MQKVYFAKFETESLRVVKARDGWLVDGLVTRGSCGTESGVARGRMVD